MRHFIDSWWSHWGWAWMLIGLAGYAVIVFIVKDGE